MTNRPADSPFIAHFFLRALRGSNRLLFAPLRETLPPATTPRTHDHPITNPGPISINFRAEQGYSFPQTSPPKKLSSRNWPRGVLMFTSPKMTVPICRRNSRTRTGHRPCPESVEGCRRATNRSLGAANDPTGEVVEKATPAAASQLLRAYESVCARGAEAAARPPIRRLNGPIIFLFLSELLQKLSPRAQLLLGFSLKSSAA